MLQGIFSRAFWKAAAERAIRAGAAGVVAAMTAGGLDWAEVPWQAAAGAGGVAAVVSLLLSLTGSTVGGGDSGPSLAGTERLTRQ